MTLFWVCFVFAITWDPRREIESSAKIRFFMIVLPGKVLLVYLFVIAAIMVLAAYLEGDRAGL